MSPHGDTFFFWRGAGLEIDVLTELEETSIQHCLVRNGCNTIRDWRNECLSGYNEIGEIGVCLSTRRLEK